MSVNHGGPAFPRSAFSTGSDSHNNMTAAGFGNTGCEGMSLRDYFAAKAMHAMLSIPQTIGVCSDDGFSGLASASYSAADAMLAEREREQPK